MDRRDQELAVTADYSLRDKSLTRNTATGSNIVNIGIANIKQ